MPIFEFQCKKCGHRFERMQKFSDPDVKKCPQCGGKVERLLSAPAVHFQGSGFYVTDYARKSGDSAEPKGDAKPEAKADSAGHSKPAADSKPAKPDHKPKSDRKK